VCVCVCVMFVTELCITDTGRVCDASLAVETLFGSCGMAPLVKLFMSRQQSIIITVARLSNIYTHACIA
jgi:hypothetical protein